MNIKQLSFTAIALLTASSVCAQDIYGGGALSFSYYGESDNGTDEGTAINGYLDAFVGTEFSGGYFIEGDISYGRAFAISDEGANNGFRNGYLLSARVGKDFGAYTLEAYAGNLWAVSGDNDGAGDDPISRYFVGIGGSYELSSQFAINGMIGYLDGDDNDSSAEDAYRNFTHLTLGVDYAISPSWTLDASATYGIGVMDGDEDVGTVVDLALGVQYQFANPNMMGYLEVRHARYDQIDESDVAIENHISIGFTYSFGQGAAERADRLTLPRYMEWVAAADGHLE